MRPKIVWASSWAEQALAEMCAAKFIGVQNHAEHSGRVLTSWRNGYAKSEKKKGKHLARRRGNGVELSIG